MGNRTDITYFKKIGSINSKSAYIKTDKSFNAYTELPTISLMIGHQYLSLEVDCCSRFIIGISGYFDLEWCEKQSVEPLPLKK